MRRGRNILFALPVLALALAFWFLALGPKREEAAELQDEVEALEAAVNDQEQVVVAAEHARKAFPRNYRRVVVLGKAVPEDSDTSSLLVQLSDLAAESGVAFRAIKLSDAVASATPPPAAPSGSVPAQPTVEEVPAEGTEAAPVAPTEVAAATLPLGATIGPAGLPVMPYELQFRGDFFAIAKFIGKVNKMVELGRDGKPAAFGRLITVDGFALSTPDETTGASAGATLEASFAVTTYVTPEDEGLTAGASPTGPAPPEPAPVTDSSESAPTAPTASAGASVTGAAP